MVGYLLVSLYSWKFVLNSILNDISGQLPNISKVSFSSYNRFSDILFGMCKVSKSATVVEGDPNAPSSIATPLRSRGGRYSFLWIVPLYPWYVPYIAEY